VRDALHSQERSASRAPECARRGSTEFVFENLIFTLDQQRLLLKVTFVSNAAIEKIQRTVGLLLIALIFGLGLASVYPDLHRALHHDNECASHCDEIPDDDSQDEGHICGVTLLQTGAIFFANILTLEVVGPLVEVVQNFSGASIAQASFTLPLGRAPPIVGTV